MLHVYYVPHPAQRQIHWARGKRFRTVCTGRRFGKTMCLAGELMDRGCYERAGDYGWVAPTYNVADRGIEAFQKIGGNEGFVQVHGQAPSRVEFKGPLGLVRIWFLSADNPDSIRGFGFLGMVIDEAAAIPKDVWNFVLRPTVSQTLGWVVFVSTPAGRNWFYDMHTRGLDPSERDYASFTFPSNASPYFPAKEWEEARRTLPENVFRQEYMAEFLEDSAGVFRNVDACLIPEIEPRMNADGRGWEAPRDVAVGCDIAKHTDFTVLIAMDSRTGRCLEMERFNQLDWPIQKERILAFVMKWRARLIMDSTGIGDPVMDDLRRVWGDVEGYKLTSQSKTELIQRLIVAIEQRQVSWPAGGGVRVNSKQSTVNSGERQSDSRAVGRSDCGNWEVLTAELKRYEYTIMPSGGISYNAPSGFHDDCVIALALANHRRWASECCGSFLRLGGERRPLGWRSRRAERVIDM